MSPTILLSAERVVLDPMTDLSAEGDTEPVTVGEAVSVGDVLYEAADDKFWKADASSETTSAGKLVMAIESKSADQSCMVLLYGKMRDDSWNWTPGEILYGMMRSDRWYLTIGNMLYISTTPGGPTTTRPSLTGEIVRIIGYTHTATIVFFNPEPSYLVITLPGEDAVSASTQVSIS